MKIIMPATLTNEIAKSAAVQMAEFDYSEKKKAFIGVDLASGESMTAFVPSSVVEKIVKSIPVGAGGDENE